MSKATTRGVHVDVRSFFVPDRSNPDRDHYFFAYRVRISNRGAAPVQLISRRWVITSGDGHTEEVNGPGVVGEQPHLNPGEEFRYSSGAVLETPVGAMQGLYRMEADNGVNFDAPIAPFTLAVPGVLH